MLIDYQENMATAQEKEKKIRPCLENKEGKQIKRHTNTTSERG